MSVTVMQVNAPLAHAAAGGARVHVCGKFLCRGTEKIYIRGVTYGTFRPDVNGCEFHDPARVERDFMQIAANGFNTVRIYTVPPRWLLDAAQRHGLLVMVGLPWEQHIAFLDDPSRRRSIEQRVRAGVRACAAHPGVLCFTIGNEIPAPLVRWYGYRRVERFLKRLYQAAKEEDPCALITYVNYPSTEYLELPFVDFVCFNVYLEAEEHLRAYLARLQNRAGDRPLVMAEIGLDSRRNGTDMQASTLQWQLRAVFAAGCAGAVIFSWTDEWHRGGYDVEDWDFGLTDRARRPKPALAAVRQVCAELPLLPPKDAPRISVVVCSYNGARTLGDTCEALMHLEYPNYEVIVVDDGSNDETAALARRFGFRVISTENRGLSRARNTGLAAATGEIVAYIDDDAYPDPHWLTYLADAFVDGDVAGAGGPNLPPPGDGLVAACVAAAPGGPVHVLVSDEIAEHLPGCNMAFRKSSLDAIGGFDPVFRAAGDDVDMCWRLQERGWRLRYVPAAVVWHHRRNSLRAYWRQQKGYGKAEALLERKWPQKYNACGHVSWTGRLYGSGITRALGDGRRRVLYGSWGSAPFQLLYQTDAGLVPSLLLMPEWYLVVLALAALTLLGLSWPPLFVATPALLVALAALPLQASRSAARASFAPEQWTRRQRIGLYALTTTLHLVQPVARLRGRMRHGLTPWRRRATGLAIARPREVTIWSEQWHAPVEWLSSVEATLRAWGCPAQRGGSFDRWDVQVRGGLLGRTRLRATVEEHGGGKQLVRFRLWPRLWLGSPLLGITCGLTGCLAAYNHAWIAAAALGVAAALVIGRSVYEASASMASSLHAVRALDPARQGAGTGTAQNTPAEAGHSARTSRSESLEIFRRLASQARPYWPHLGVLFLLNLCGIAISLLTPLPLKIAVDSLGGIVGAPAFLQPLLPGGATTQGSLLFAALLFVCIAALGQVQQLANQMLGTYTGEQLVLGFRLRLFRHVQRLSLLYHDSNGTTDSLYRLEYDAPCIQYIAVDGLIPLLTAALTLAGMIYVTARLDPELSAIALLVVPVISLVSWRTARSLRRQAKAVKKLESSAMSVVAEVLGALRVVRAFGREDFEQERFLRRSVDSVWARIRFALAVGLVGAAIGLALAVGTAAVLFAGMQHVRAGVLTLGELLMVMAYLAQLYDPIQTIARKTSDVQSSLAGAQRMFTILDQPPDVVDKPDARPLARASGAICFQHVTFSYTAEREVLHDISFDIEPGARVGIAGTTGAGKTTLVSLLTRLYDPTEGAILLDEMDLREYRVADLRNQFGIVLQEPVLFSTTIAENIAYGRLGASTSEIIEAARAANIHDFITQLPDGYETQVGERGMKLSGGERQRISLARAFLKNAPILILDEPTSSVDLQTEALIMEAMERLMQGRTTLMIAHRLSTLTNCDLQLRIEHGRLVTAAAVAVPGSACVQGEDLERSHADA